MDDGHRSADMEDGKGMCMTQESGIVEDDFGEEQQGIRKGR